MRGLLNDASVPFENNQEAFALSALLDRLEAAAARSGGAHPAPAADVVPDLARYKTLSGNDLLSALASAASVLRGNLKAWRDAETKITARLPAWQLAEQLVGLGAEAQATDADSVRSGRLLIAEPDPVPPIIAQASDTLRAKLNDLHARWEAAWKAGEDRLANDPTWGRSEARPEARTAPGRAASYRCPSRSSTPRKRSRLHFSRAGSPNGIVRSRLCRRVSTMRSPQRQRCSSPRREPLSLSGGLLKSEAEVDVWLKKLRGQIVEALADGPVIPKV